MIDLHMHTKYSDGTDNVSEIIDNVKKVGIDIFAITDHDTAGADREILNSLELKNKINKYGLNLVTGAEFTCIFNGQKMHILAYDFDPFASEVLSLESEMTNLLKEKNMFKIKAIEDKGYKFSEKSKEFLNAQVNIRKLHLANCLVDDGYFSDIQDAISNLINTIKLEKPYRLDAGKVIETLSGIGAKMVWAHSLHGINEKPLSLDKVAEYVPQLKALGLAGLECYYCLYNSDEIEALKNIAKENGLFVTAGSDYHGTNKNVNLGEISNDGITPKANEILPYNIFNNII